MPKKLAVNWNRTSSNKIENALKKYERYLGEQGLRVSTIEEYIFGLMFTEIEGLQTVR